MRTVDFVVALEDGVRKRHTHVARGKRIVEFVVQLEVMVDGQWRAVVRYDTAHGIAHRDTYIRKRKSKMTALDMTFETALTYAEWDVDSNWETYVLEYRGGRR